MSVEHPRVLIVAEHASARFGGEAFLPLHYFRVLRRRGVEAWLLCHCRVADEMRHTFPEDQDRLLFIPDLPVHRFLWAITRRIPERLGSVTTGAVSNLATQVLQRRLVRQIVVQERIDVVHVPIPVSPKQPSAIFGVGAPVVIGPMNGGMNYPEGFSKLQGRIQRAGVHLARHASNLLNRAIPGKRQAAMLLVANERTRQALPRSLARRPVVELPENGVELERFEYRERRRKAGEAVHFAFVGRLVGWKAVDLLLCAMSRAVKDQDVVLDIFGDGCERPRLEGLARQLNIEHRVRFWGFVPQSELPGRLAEVDVLVLPSLLECGGAVVLEAMAVGLPVIATRWGGPADYVDPSCGILIDATTPDQMTHDLHRAMCELARSPETRTAMGRAGRAKILARYDWEDKVDRVLELYASVAGLNVRNIATEITPRQSNPGRRVSAARTIAPELPL